MEIKENSIYDELSFNSKPYNKDKENDLLILKATEMLEMLKRINSLLIKREFPTENELISINYEIETLIEEATKNINI